MIPWCAAHGVAVVAYSPFGHDSFPAPDSAGGAALAAVAARHGATPRQVALCALTRAPDVFAIPKTGRPERARENAAAGDLVLDADDLARLDATFPRGAEPRSLPML